MQVAREDLLNLFQNELKVTTADKWNDERMLKKVEKLPELIGEDHEFEDAECSATWRKLKKALDKEDTIEILSEETELAEEEEPEETDEEAPKKKKSKKAAAEAKPSKNGKADKSDTKGKKAVKSGPGVIATIVELVTEASAKSPVTKDEILDELCKRFKDRAREAMHKTISIQLPSRLNKEKKLGVVRSESGGYFIPKSK